jgi:uncharacterized membrane protein
MPKELITIFIALSPLAELRGAIPVAIGVFHFTWWKALSLSIIGNIIFIIPLMWFLEKFSDFLMQKFVFWRRFFNWLFQRTRTKIEKHYKKYSRWALTIFVAIPLPMTGAWTGSVAAYLLGLNKKEAFVFISLGVIIAGVIVTLLTLLGKKVI